MSIFNINPWSAGNGGGGGTPFDPTIIPKVYEYTDVATTLDQELWEVKHPNFNPTNDKALIYINSVLIDPSIVSYENIGGNMYARIPLQRPEYVTDLATLYVIVITNAVGS